MADAGITVEDLARTYLAAARRGRLPSADRDLAVDRLVEIGLFRTGREELVPVDLAASERESTRALVREIGEIAERYASMLRLITKIRESADPRAEAPAWRPEQTEPELTYLHGNHAIVEAIDKYCANAEVEVLTAQPGGGRPAATLDETIGKTLDILRRGVQMRMLYQHTARYDEPTKNFVREVSQNGAAVRTLDEFFERLIVVDRSVAFIPGNADRSSAAMITNRSVVSFLADIYERNWVRAEQFPFEPADATRTSRDIGPSMRAALIHMLVDGLPDKQIAKRLGMSIRTTQGHVAAIRSEYGAKNRTQLGYLIAKSQSGPADAAAVPAEAF